jgi:hypothetical protein
MNADSHSAAQPDHDSSPVPSTRSRNRFWFSIAISMVFGGVGGFAAVRYLQSGGSILFLETLNLWEILVALPLLMLFVVGVHELGHLVAGLLQGMRFILLIIYPFQWLATSAGIRFGLVTDIGQLGGLAVTAPTSVGPGIKRQLFLVIAGGPIASLALAAIASIPVWFVEGRLAAYCQLVAILSFLCFLLAIIPGQFSGFMTDGMQMIDVVGDSRSMIERSAIMQIMAQSMAGIRPRDWDVNAIERADLIHSLDMPRRISAMQVLLYHAMDSQDPVGAERYSELLKSNAQMFPDGFRQSIYLELAILAALDRDTEQAATYLSLTQGGVATNESRREMAHAALCWAQENREGMQQHISAAEQAMSLTPAAGFDDLTRDQLSSLVTNRIG